MLNDFLKYISLEKLVRKNQKVLLAVSGGIDSMVMAELFTQTAIKTGIAHCNFCLRGAESDKDEALVKNFAAKHKIPFYSERFSTMDYSQEKGISIQMAARELRYSWFEEIRKKHGYDLVAVAHNLNDNAETILINLTRGTGIAGLTGMKPSGNKIIRPLLFATRASITDYCKKMKIRYREDSSNAETKYTRNKIRHLVIPVLKEINPSAEFTLNETSRRMSEALEIITRFTDELSHNIIRHEDGIAVVNISELKAAAFNDTVIYELFRDFGINGTNFPGLKKLIKSRTGSYFFTGKYRFLRDRDKMLITGISENDPLCYNAGSPGNLRKLQVFKSVKTVAVSREFRIPIDNSIACIDYGKLSFPLTIRTWKPGDYFYPLGMKKKKKLSDYFIDRKLPRLSKETMMVIESDGKIVWIVGERIDDRFKITSGTKKALVIKA